MAGIEASALRSTSADGISRLLVLDDQPENLRLIGELLADSSVELSFAKSGQQALRLASRVDFQLAILDLNLPDIDGFEVGARLRQIQPDCEQIYCSAHNDRGRRDRAFSEGAIDFIEKPFEIGVTRRRLRTHLERMALKIGLKAERDKLDAMIASIPDAIISTDAEQRIVMWNAAATTMFGASADEVLGRGVAEFLPPDCLAPPTAPEVNPPIGNPVNAEAGLEANAVANPEAGTQADAARPVDGTDAKPIDLGRLRADGRRTEVELKLSRWTQDGKTFTTYILRDVTERALLLEALQRAKDDAEQASQAKSSFLANMSHEIRTPMNAVIGMTHLALRQTQEPRARDYLDKIQHSARHLLGIINDILDFSKIEADKLSLEHIDFDLGDVLENFSNLVADKATAKGLALRYDVHPAVPRRLRGDPLRLAQVLINYGNNAVKFTERGEIELSVEVAARDADGVQLRFAVRDTGIGIDPQHMSSLFQSFQQADTSTSRRFGGTGLGLAIAKRLATMMDGEVGVDSRPGEGSTFWFTARLGATPSGAAAPGTPPGLPSGPAPGEPEDANATTAADAAASAAAAAHRAAGTPGGTHEPGAEGHARSAQAEVGAAESAPIRVLVVDDNAVNLMIAHEMLSNAGMDVTDASDGEQAVNRVRADRFDLVLMDMQMPVMDGLEATRHIRAMADRQGLLILAMTANAMTADRNRCLEAGMDDVLTKPIEPDLLVDSVRRWVRFRRG